MTTFLIILAVVATVAVVCWFLFQRQHPENAATHTPADTVTTSDQLYKTADRPAGPDAETMDPDQLGGDHRPPS